MSAFRIEVRVMPRAALLDPQGQAVEHALHALGFGEVARVRMGKHLVLEVKAASRDEALARARVMCDRLLANPVTEDYDLAVDGGVARCAMPGCGSSPGRCGCGWSRPTPSSPVCTKRVRCSRSRWRTATAGTWWMPGRPPSSRRRTVWCGVTCGTTRTVRSTKSPA